MSLINVYNEITNNDTTNYLDLFLNANPLLVRPSASDHMLWLGNFNRHHPYWDHEEDQHLFMPNTLQAAEHLLGVVADWSMSMVLPPRIPTHEHYVSRRCTVHRVDHRYG